MPSVYDFTNYRDFLKAYYEIRKAEDGYTYRDFAKSAGMNSSSWMVHLIKGTKNLSPESILRVGKGLRFKKRELHYFELMVLFTQAKTNEDKSYYFEQMVSLKKQLKLVSISEEQYEYFTKWYHPVIRSLVSKITWGEDFKKLAAHTIPEISPGEARKSVSLLKKLGYITKDEQGKWKQTSRMISTGDEVLSLNISNYHKQVSKLASDAHERLAAEMRDISALILGINGEDAEKIKTRIREFRKEILEIAQESGHADRVFQLNFQFFQVSRPGDNP